MDSYSLNTDDFELHCVPQNEDNSAWEISAPISRAEIEERIRAQIASRLSFSCDQCEYATSIGRYLINHKLNIHGSVETDIVDEPCKFTMAQKRRMAKYKRSVEEKIMAHRQKFLAFKCDQCEYATALSGGLTRHKIALHYNLKEVRVALRRLTQEDVSAFERKETNPTSIKRDQFEFVSLSPIEVKEEQVSVNECKMCDFAAPQMQTILLVRHMREEHGVMAGEKSVEVKRRRLDKDGDDPLSHVGGFS